MQKEMAPRKAVVEHIERIGDDTRLFSLRSLEDLGFVGGKWIMLNPGLQLQDGKTAKRAYSIMSSDCEQQRFQIAVKQIPGGITSSYLHEKIDVGHEIEFSGPYGKRFHIYEEDLDHLQDKDQDKHIDRHPGQNRDKHNDEHQDRQNAEAATPLPPLLVIATDTGITAALGVLCSQRAAPFLERASLIWFLERRDYFLEAQMIEERLPRQLRSRFQVELIAPIHHQGRRQEARRIVEGWLKEQEMARGLAFLSGDGEVIFVLRDLLYIYGYDQANVRLDPFFNSKEKKGAPKDPALLRSGFTTGACSAAAAGAAARALLLQRPIHEIEIELPNHSKVTFPIKQCELERKRALCSVVKDAGDDPDCTHLAELRAEVRLLEHPEVRVEGGSGVARVTKPGLGLEVGQPAINPVPRRNIIEMVQRELEGTEMGAEVIITVPNGEELARQTTNARLGLIGGISILGTSGIVKPFSTAAFRTSVVQAIDVAKERGHRELVLTTGGRSEEYAMKHRPHLKEEAFIQVGDFIGVGIKHIKRVGIPHAIIFGMIGKLSKMADGVTQTHQAGSRVDTGMLARLAAALGADRQVEEEIAQANTARHILEICRKRHIEGLPSLLCRRVVTVMTNYAEGRPKEQLLDENAANAALARISSGAGKADDSADADNSADADDKADGSADRKVTSQGGPGLRISCYMVDFEGQLLGQYPPAPATPEAAAAAAAVAATAATAATAEAAETEETVAEETADVPIAKAT